MKIIRIFLVVIVGMFLFLLSNMFTAFAEDGAVKSLPFGGQLKQFTFFGLTAEGVNNVWVVGAFGQIAYSSDGGKEWKLQNSTVQSELYDVDFINDKVGWAAGRFGVILKTTDGGNTWAKLASNSESALFGISFVDSNNGWVVGERNTILHTDNGGKTWTKQDEENDRILNKVVAVDADTCWAFGEYGTIIKTSDAGNTWPAQVNPRGTDIIYGACFTDNQHGITVGIDGYMLSTEDGGETWNALESCMGETLYSIKIIGQKAWAVGMKGSYCVSEDGGKTWANKTGALNVFVWLYRVYFASEDVGWACGANGTIVLTHDGGKTWHMPDKLTLR